MDGTGLNDSGKQVQNVAKNSATLWTTYQVMPQLTLGAGAIAMDKVYAMLQIPNMYQATFATMLWRVTT
jgi:outer membrane receptor for monomeric catechols